jgi:phenylalanyl-tRNA synthetase beta chain
VLDRNVRAGAERVAIFEIGRTFLPPQAKEHRHLGILLWGNATSAPHWRLQGNYPLDFFDLKGAIESLALPAISFRRGDHPDLSLATEISSNERAIGFGGQLREGRIDAAGAVFVAELDVDLVLRGAELRKTFREIEKFPSITRDIAMIVPDEIPHEKILRTIEEPREPLLESVELFDLFTEQVGAPQKSLAYRLTYRDRSRTLTSDEVSEVHARIRERLKRDLGVTLRE